MLDLPAQPPLPLAGAPFLQAACRLGHHLDQSHLQPTGCVSQPLLLGGGEAEKALGGAGGGRSMISSKHCCLPFVWRHQMQGVSSHGKCSGQRVFSESVLDS